MSKRPQRLRSKIVFIYPVTRRNEDAAADKWRTYWQFKFKGARNPSELYTRRWSALRGARRVVRDCSAVWRGV